MQAIRAVMIMHARDKLAWFIMPWAAQIAAFLVTLLDGLLFHRQGAWSSYGGAGDIYIYYFALGIISINKTFPFALGFSVRRKDYVLGTAALVVVLFAATAVVLASLEILESHVFNSWGVNLHFFALPYLSAGSFLQQWWVDFSLLANLFALGFVIGSVYRRFGNWGLLAFFVGALLVLTTWIGLSIHLNRWAAVAAWFSQHAAPDFALVLLPVTELYLLGVYLLLRRAVV